MKPGTLKTRPRTKGLRDIYTALVRECDRLGLPKPIVISGGKCNKLVVRIDGEEYFLPIPVSSGDNRNRQNSLSDLRRLVRRVRSQEVAA